METIKILLWLSMATDTLEGRCLLKTIVALFWLAILMVALVVAVRWFL